MWNRVAIAGAFEGGYSVRQHQWMKSLEVGMLRNQIITILLRILDHALSSQP